jgi:hypothetical protein
MKKPSTSINEETWILVNYLLEEKQIRCSWAYRARKNEHEAFY